MITTDAIYSTLIASGSYEESITGTLKDGSGTTVLNTSNEYIKTGSLIIDNKCINNDDLEPGAVYAAELKITITGNAGLTSSQKSSLQNGSLNLTYTITDGDNSSSISIGIYYIIEVTLKDEDVEIIAEDMMSRLSKNIPTAVREDLNFVARTPYELLDLCCQNCSTSRRPISLANDETEFDTWCNADASFLIPVTADIATYRDLVAEVAKIMGCFATIDKATNGLILKRLNPHSNSNVWTLNEDIRYSTEKSGYVCLFGKVALGSVSYPTTSDDDVSGLILSMRASELTDDSELLPGVVQNLYTELRGISYRPCKIDFMGNIALEVGDWIGVNYTEDGNTYTFRTIITHFTWILNGKELIESTGSSAATTKKVGSKGSGESRNSSSIDNLENRIETLESAQGGKEVHTSTADPSITDGNNDNVWFKYTLEAGLKFDNGATYPDKWYYMGCFRGEYTGYGEGWCYIWANNYPIPQDVNTGEGYLFPFYEYNAGNRIVKLGIRCHKDRYAQIVDTAAVTFYVISKAYPLGRYFTGEWMYCDMDANYQQYLGIKSVSASTVLWGVALYLSVQQIDVTRQYVAIDGVSTLTNIAKRTNAEWVKINGEWVLVSEDIGSEVVVTPTLTKGTEIGEIEVSGNSKKLYAPTPQSVSVAQTQTSGTEIATINVGDTSTTLYAPTTTVTQTLTEGTEIGEVNGTKLYAPSGGGSDVTVTPITTTGTNIANIAVNGTTYNLFAPTSGGGGSHNYSTTEQVIGTWIDGKPVYEITYEFTTALTINSTSYIHSGITPVNIKSLIGMPDIIDVHGQSAPIMAGLYSDGEIALALLNATYSIDLKYLIIRYTKTTD